MSLLKTFSLDFIAGSLATLGRSIERCRPCDFHDPWVERRRGPSAALTARKPTMTSARPLYYDPCLGDTVDDAQRHDSLLV